MHSSPLFVNWNVSHHTSGTSQNVVLSFPLDLERQTKTYNCAWWKLNTIGMSAWWWTGILYASNLHQGQLCIRLSKWIWTSPPLLRLPQCQQRRPLPHHQRRLYRLDQLCLNHHSHRTNWFSCMWTQATLLRPITNTMDSSESQVPLSFLQLPWNPCQCRLQPVWQPPKLLVTTESRTWSRESFHKTTPDLVLTNDRSPACNFRASLELCQSKCNCQDNNRQHKCNCLENDQQYTDLSLMLHSAHNNKNNRSLLLEQIPRSFREDWLFLNWRNPSNLVPSTCLYSLHSLHHALITWDKIVANGNFYSIISSWSG